VSLLLIGAGVMGQSTLAEFAMALLIGMLTGAYSSIFVAAPLLAVLKKTDKSWEGRNIQHAVGEALRDMVMGGVIGSRRTRAVAAQQVDSRNRGSSQKAAPSLDGNVAQTKAALTHPPRPRKKKRR
jgi:preprotein translocase subunit SecF